MFKYRPSRALRSSGSSQEPNRVELALAHRWSQRPDDGRRALPVFTLKSKVKTLLFSCVFAALSLLQPCFTPFFVFSHSSLNIFKNMCIVSMLLKSLCPRQALWVASVYERCYTDEVITISHHHMMVNVQDSHVETCLRVRHNDSTLFRLHWLIS